MSTSCPDCHHRTAPYDIEPWQGEQTAAYECPHCGALWTQDLKEIHS